MVRGQMMRLPLTGHAPYTRKPRGSGPGVRGLLGQRVAQPFLRGIRRPLELAQPRRIDGTQPVGARPVEVEPLAVMARDRAQLLDAGSIHVPRLRPSAG